MCHTAPMKNVRIYLHLEKLHLALPLNSPVAAALRKRMFLPRKVVASAIEMIALVGRSSYCHWSIQAQG